MWSTTGMINPLNAESNPICHLLALLGAHHIFHVSRIRVKFYVSGMSWRPLPTQAPQFSTIGNKTWRTHKILWRQGQYRYFRFQ
jgi:hypothetical protein